MCVTEIWTYRECGCHYKHSILCRSYRRNRSPCFAPVIQYPLEEWLQANNQSAEAALKQIKRRPRPAEPQQCPHHSTVRRSFLNQICEECLSKHNKVLSPTLPSTCLPGPCGLNGEGLIWDSDVKIEIDDMHFEMLPTKWGLEPFDLLNDSDDDERRILESHVEITVEPAVTAVSPVEEDLSFSMSNRPLSRTPSIASTCLSSISSLRMSTSSHSKRNRRYGFALPTGLHYELDDADDEFDESSDSHDLTLMPSRGRSVKRGVAEALHILDDGSDLPSQEKPLTRFRSLRSISSPFGSGSKSQDEEKLNESDSQISSSPGSLISTKGFFRRLRTRKTSGLIVDTIEDKLNQLQLSSSPYGRLDSGPQRKPTLKSWAEAIIPDKRHRQGNHRPEYVRSRAPSPTDSLTLNQERQLDELPILDTMSDTAFDTDSVLSYVGYYSEEIETYNMREEPGSPWSPCSAPSTPTPQILLSRDFDQSTCDGGKETLVTELLARNTSQSEDAGEATDRGATASSHELPKLVIPRLVTLSTSTQLVTSPEEITFFPPMAAPKGVTPPASEPHSPCDRPETQELEDKVMEASQEDKGSYFGRSSPPREGATEEASATLPPPARATSDMDQDRLAEQKPDAPVVVDLSHVHGPVELTVRDSSRDGSNPKIHEDSNLGQSSPQEGMSAPQSRKEWMPLGESVESPSPRSLLSPRSILLQNNSAANKQLVKSHPPRKSSLRRLIMPKGDIPEMPTMRDRLLGPENWSR